MSVRHIKSHLIEGDAMTPDGSDIIAQLGTIDAPGPVPEGWRVLTGNEFQSQVSRVVLRYELDEWSQIKNGGLNL